MEQDDNYQSLSDLLSAMLFVFIITLIAYIINFTSNRDVGQTLGEQMADYKMRKSSLLQQVSEGLNTQSIQHSLNTELGIISISSDQVGFHAGSHRIPTDQQNVVENIATALGSEIVCYLSPPKEIVNKFKCADATIGQLQRVYVEGHTDNVPFTSKSSLRNNTDLSLMRAATFKSVIEKHLLLKNFSGLNDLNGLIVPTGFGASKPKVQHGQIQSDVRNRRIEIRFELNKPWEHAKL